MMGLENPLHILIVLVVVLLVFGAKRLPEMGQSLGSGLRGFKQSLTGELPAPSGEQLRAGTSRVPSDASGFTARDSGSSEA